MYVEDLNDLALLRPVADPRMGNTFASVPVPPEEGSRPAVQGELEH